MQEKILIIDDDRTILNVTAELLRISGYATIAAEDGHTGITLAGQERPDVIICDIMMPGISGYEVLDVLGRDSATAVIPFIFLTSKDSHDDQRRGMRMGASDYLTKPLNGYDLLLSVESRLRKCHAVKKESLPDSSSIPPADPWQPLREAGRGNFRYEYSRNEVLFSEGDVQKHIFLLDKGKVKTMKTNDNGKRIITGFYGDGDFIGCAVRPGSLSTYSDTAAVQEDAEVMKIPVDNFYTFLDRSRDAMTAFLRFMSKDLDRKDALMINIALHSARKRMAEVLLLAAEYYKEFSNDKDSLFIPMSREDLANLSGLSTESAIRILSSFRKEGLIMTDDKGHVIVHDITRLKKQKN